MSNMDLPLTLCNLHADVLFHVFMSMTNLYEMIQCSIINRYMYTFYSVYKGIIFYNKTKYCQEFLESSYKYFFNFTKSIHNTHNDLLNNNIIKIKSALQIFSKFHNYTIYSHFSFKDVQNEFIQNINYNKNHIDLYNILFCPCLLLFKNAPVIECWYLVVKRNKKRFNKLNKHFFDIIKMHLYELKKKDYSLFKKVLHSQISNSHSNNEFYYLLFDVLYELDEIVFVNELKMHLSNYKVTKDNLKDMDMLNYRYEGYIDYTSDEIEHLYIKYRLNESRSCLVQARTESGCSVESGIITTNEYRKSYNSYNSYNHLFSLRTLISVIL